MKAKIDADTQTFVRFWLVPLGIVVAGYAIYSARTALIILGCALFLALALNAPVNKVAKWLPGQSRVGGTALAYVMVIAVIAAFITLVVPPVVQQTAKFVETVPVIVDQVADQYRGVDQVINKYHLEDQVDQAVDSLKDNATSWATGLGSNIVGSLTSVFGFIFTSFLVLVLSFLMLIEGPTLLRKIWDLYDDQPKMEYHRQLTHRMYNVVNGYVIGQLTVAGIGAVMTGLLVFVLSFIFDIPGNLAIPSAAIYFLLTLIPLFGSTIAAILISLLLILNDPVSAIVFIVIYVIYQQIENNVISPTVQSKRIELSALWILAAVTIGIYVFGLLGGIISIPIAGCLKIVFDEYVTYSRQKRGRSGRSLVQLAKKSAAKKDTSKA